ncbi:MAG: hypothetical protein U0V87_10690, partial [Acidobacteriota bacterium]
VYLIGGMVRDLLLQRDSIDVDLVIDGDALRIARAVGAALNLPVACHPRFGTAHIEVPSDSPSSVQIDFASARRETYAYPGALPQVEAGSIVDDARRRDFTINALGIRLNGPPESRRDWIDPGTGLSDLRAGLIRVLHPQSFLDDPTRLFRAVRFAARFQFTIEPQTSVMLQQALRGRALATIAGERIRREIELLCDEAQPGRGLLLAQTLGVWDALQPGWEPLRAPLIEDGGLDRHLNAWSDCAAAREVTRSQLALCCLFASLSAGQADSVIRQLAFDRQRRALLQAVQEQGEILRNTLASRRTSGDSPPPPSIVHALLADIPVAALVFLDLVWHSWPNERASLQRELRTTRDVRLEIGGEDLVTAGIPAGPSIGRRLALTLAAKQDGVVFTRADELSFALAQRNDG